MKALFTNKKVIVSAVCVLVAAVSAVVVVRKVKAAELEVMVEDYCE